MYNTKRRVGLIVAIVLLSILTGCIKPTPEPEASPTPSGVINSGAVPPAGGATSPLSASIAAVDQFLRGRGETPANLQVWYERPQGPDRLQGFSYNRPDGVMCAGFLLTAFSNGVWQPNNGALSCAIQPGVTALASVSLFATTDGQPYTVVFGYVQDPTISAVVAEYAGGGSKPATPALGGFLIVEPGVLGVNLIAAINVEGNTVIPNIPQSPTS